MTLTEAGKTHTVDAIFPDPVAFICSKALALGGSKRPRDAYDIFVTLEGQGSRTCAEQLYDLAKTSPTARRCLETLRSFMREEAGVDLRSKQFISSFNRNDFFKKLSIKEQFAYTEDASRIVREFLEVTDHYPDGMKVHD